MFIKKGNMQLKELEEKIIKEGKVIGKDILKVDGFINHQVDSDFMYKIGDEFRKYFENHHITKIFTIESSGIAPALMTAYHMRLPLVILKKQSSKVLNEEILSTPVHSFTKDVTYELTLSKKFINKDDRILLIDDFLAQGEASMGAARLIEKANAKLSGIGIIIEKSFQPGRKKLEEKGYDVYSLARISSLENNEIKFWR